MSSALSKSVLDRVFKVRDPFKGADFWMQEGITGRSAALVRSPSGKAETKIKGDKPITKNGGGYFVR